MHHSMLAAGAAILALTAHAGTVAAAPAQLTAEQSVTIDASPTKIWSIIGHFGNLTWHPAVAQSHATQGDTPGSVRTLDLGGPKLIEQLVSYDGPAMTYTYRITDDPANVKVLPVTVYRSTISVTPAPNDGSTVTWRGTFMRADPSDAPQAGQDDAAALKAINGVYGSGLARLKEEAEAD